MRGGGRWGGGRKHNSVDKWPSQSIRSLSLMTEEDGPKTYDLCYRKMIIKHIIPRDHAAQSSAETVLVFPR